MNNKILCIAGMHRSGTSLTTSWLEKCGLTIHDGNLIGPAVGNLKGHFEDKDFVQLHSSAIKLTFPNSKGWKISNQQDIKLSNTQKDQAKTLVEQRNKKYQVWGWKDPRTVIFLEQWKEIIPDLNVLLIWRPCNETVQSLLHRSKKASESIYKINIWEAMNLWYYSNKKAYFYKQKYNKNTLLLPLNYIVENDKLVFDLLNDHFKLNLNYQPFSNIYNKKELQKRQTNITLNLLSLYFKSSELEQKLQEMSDLMKLYESKF